MNIEEIVKTGNKEEARSLGLKMFMFMEEAEENDWEGLAKIIDYPIHEHADSEGELDSEAKTLLNGFMKLVDI